MGRWGLGVFENDLAVQFLNEHVAALAESVECMLANSDSDLDVQGEEVLVPAVRMMEILSRSLGAAPPSSATVAEWKLVYMEKFDLQGPEIYEGDALPARRRIVESAFDGLHDIALSYELGKRDSGGPDDRDGRESRTI